MRDGMPAWIDPQEWVEMRPFPPNPQYLVSPHGRVLNVKRTGWLIPCVMKRGGYLAVNLWADNKGHLWTLNKVVAWTFYGLPQPPRIHAAHNDGDKSNNTRNNIAWKTKAENEADKISHGTTNRGERNGMAKLTDAKCAEIRAVAQTMVRGRGALLSKQYGVSAGAISAIINGRRRSK